MFKFPMVLASLPQLPQLLVGAGKNRRRKWGTVKTGCRKGNLGVILFREEVEKKPPNFLLSAARDTAHRLLSWALLAPGCGTSSQAGAD
jgi:hypothetical protein